ncbi:geraniol 8-hydroxylase [Ziziphus jujuba]|uniref:Geraniol 8-hydroxylase n=1 Tax=Ziziphus jujuba TaxID=326968 RepID=A0A6P4AHW6_ZIZJJ|nr:geraniol 8-hydroxylase [Ziziphus jujuba]
MDFCNFLLCLLVIWISRQALLYFVRSKRLPPGPKPLPIIGNLLELGEKPHKSLAKLSKRFGPIMSLKLGQVTTIVVSSASMAKEVLQTHDQFFSNRTIPDSLKACKHDEFCLPFLPVSTRWKNLRKICNTYLFSGKVLNGNQNLRNKKVEELLANVTETMSKGEALDIGRAAFKTTLNLLSTTIFSLDLADPIGDNARELKGTVWGILEEVGTPNLADYFPFLKKIDPQGIRKRSTIHLAKLIQLFNQIINKRLQFRRKMPGSISDSDMLDTLVNISEQNCEDMDKTRIGRLFVDLFVAGTDTTSATVEWAMAELLSNPEILSKAKAELDQVIGKGNQVKESDTAKLPYLQAIIKETFRLHPAVPLLLPRRAEADVEISGFTVPKGAQILVNAWAIGRDSSMWENPNSFKPERFLGSDIDVRGQSFELIPFGSGRRICPGLPLAMRMLYLILGSLIHSFAWELEDEKITMDDKFGLTLQLAQPLRALPSSLPPAYKKLRCES